MIILESDTSIVGSARKPSTMTTTPSSLAGARTVVSISIVRVPPSGDSMLIVISPNSTSALYIVAPTPIPSYENPSTTSSAYAPATMPIDSAAAKDATIVAFNTA